MKRRTFLQSSLLGAVSIKGNIEKTLDDEVTINSDQKTVHKSKQPHIIFIIDDQHRGDVLGCMGNKAVKTPNIDKLAKEGTLFVSGYTASPSSTPARAGLLTGMSPWHHGMLGYGRVAEHYTYEMPQMLRNLGYYTYGIGKMHWFPQKCLHGFHGTLIDESGRVESKNFMSDYRQWFQLHAPGKDPDLTGIDWNDHSAGVYKLPEHLHPTCWTGQTACELIRNYDLDKPLFLKVSFARPHSPYDPPKRLLDKYKNVEIPKPVAGDWCKDKKYAQLRKPEEVSPSAAFANMGDDYAVNSRRHYYANVTFVDEQIGDIIKELKKKGMYDDAVICFTADHGDMLGDHYHWRKTYPYEGSTHIPYIIKWPKWMDKDIPNGSKIDQPVELRDFLPTFIELGGGSIPPDMDGASLLKLVKGKTSQWRKYIDMEHATCYSADNYWCALTDGKMKYVWNFHNGSEQLFDLKKDPYELKEISSQAEYAACLKEMRQAMVDHLSERGEQFVKDGQLVTLKKTMLYSPEYPQTKK